MNDQTQKETLLRNYLLGKVTEEEAEAIEQTLLTESQDFEDAQVLEDELCDDYVLGSLSTDDRRSYEARLRSAHDQKCMRFAVAWWAYVGRKRVNAASRKENVLSKWFRLTPRAAVHAVVWSGSLAVLLLFTTVFFIRRTWEVEREFERNRQTERMVYQPSEGMTAAVEGPSEAAEYELPKVTSKAQSTFMSSIILTPGLSRGLGSTPTLSIRENTELMELDLRVADNTYDQYQAFVYDADGHQISMQGQLDRVAGKAGATVPVRLSARGFRKGTYTVRLEATNSEGQFIALGTYRFQVALHHGN